ncbi:hypothetical protein PanWU01x14_053510, partial [Parasponia andersonii]
MVMDLRHWSINGAHIMVCDSSSDVTNLQINFSHTLAFGFKLMEFLQSSLQRKIRDPLVRRLRNSWSLSVQAEGHIIAPLDKPQLPGFYVQKDKNSKLNTFGSPLLRISEIHQTILQQWKI